MGTRLRQARQLIWRSIVMAALRPFWVWVGGRVWRWVGGSGAILSGLFWLFSRAERLDQSWVIGSAIGFCFCLFVTLLSAAIHAAQRRASRPTAPPPAQLSATPLLTVAGAPAQSAVSLEAEAPHATLTDGDVADIIRHLPGDQWQLLQQCVETGVGYDFPPYFTALPLVKNGFIKALFEESTRFPNSIMYNLSPRVEASVKAYFSAVSPPPVEPGFTSDGLDWKPLFGGGVLRIVPTESGTDLPQPLTLRVQCSTEPKDGWATFYSDAKVGDSNRGYDPVRAEIKGNAAYFVLKAPKLRAPAMLSVNLIGISAEEVEDVQRRQ